MVDYSMLADNLTKERDGLNSDYESFTGLLNSLKGNFIGNSATKLCNDLSNSLNGIQNQIAYIDSLVNLLKLINTHQGYVKSLNEAKQNQLAWTATEETDVNPYIATVSSYEQKIKETESAIKNGMISVNALATSVNVVNASSDSSYKDFIGAASIDLGSISGLKLYLNSYDNMVADAAVWIKDFQNPDYWTSGLNQRLSDVEGFPTAEELDQMIEDVAGNASPRTRAVASAMTLISLEHDYHLTTRYILSMNLKKGVYGTGKPYNTKTLVNEGADCASFMSWALNKANPDKPFNNSTVTNVANQGKETDYASLKPGDILYGAHGSHVAMVICNEYEENGSIIVADTTNQGNQYLSSWTASGIRLKRYDEHALLASYKGRDMSEFYGEVEA